MDIQTENENGEVGELMDSAEPWDSDGLPGRIDGVPVIVDRRCILELTADYYRLPVKAITCNKTRASGVISEARKTAALILRNVANAPVAEVATIMGLSDIGARQLIARAAEDRTEYVHIAQAVDKILHDVWEKAVAWAQSVAAQEQRAD